MKKARTMLVVLLILLVIFLLGCSQQNSAQHQIEYDWTLIQENVHTLSDGESVSIWQEGMDTSCQYYRIYDGTVLLAVDELLLPGENDEVSGITFTGLKPEVQRKIINFFATQGYLCDIHELLENAYTEHLANPDLLWDGVSDRSGKINNLIKPVHQKIDLAGANNRMVCWQTEIHYPEVKKDLNIVRNYVVFDINTGEIINAYDMFTIPAEEIGQTIFYSDYAGRFLSDVQREERIMALQSKYIGLTEKYLEIHFPVGTLVETDHPTSSHTILIDYEDVKDILQPWAIPYHEE